MNAYDIFAALGLDHLIDDAELSEEDQAKIDTDFEVHFQPNYPLKGRIDNVRMLDGKPVMAISDGNNYGSREAWEED